MNILTIAPLILALLIGLGVAAAVWRSRRAQTPTGRDQWAGQREIGFGPQIRRATLHRPANRSAARSL